MPNGFQINVPRGSQTLGRTLHVAHVTTLRRFSVRSSRQKQLAQATWHRLTFANVTANNAASKWQRNCYSRLIFTARSQKLLPERRNARYRRRDRSSAMSLSGATLLRLILFFSFSLADCSTIQNLISPSAVRRKQSATVKVFYAILTRLKVLEIHASPKVTYLPFSHAAPFIALDHRLKNVCFIPKALCNAVIWLYDPPVENNITANLA